MPKEVGWGFSRVLLIHKKGVVTSYRFQEDIESFKKYFSASLSNNFFWEKLCDKIIDYSKRLMKVTENIASSRLGFLSDDELEKSLSELSEAYANYWSICVMPAYAEMYLDKERLAPLLPLLEKTRAETGETYVKAHESFTALFNEFGRRKGVKEELLPCALPSEDLSKVNPRELALRHDFCIVEFVSTGPIVRTGVEANEFVSRNLGTAMKRFDGVLKGQPACKHGIVRGSVKLVFSLADLELVEPDSIVVAPMTTVDFTPFLRKAKAVITDEGGVTCHAAVVSRELGIPCIVGTRDATEFLHDDDEVEVDSDSGLVTVL